MSRRTELLSACAAAAALSGSHSALGTTDLRGVGTPAVRLELRIVPQRGLPGDPAGVTDLAGTAHDQIAADGAVRRFEIQYRLIDNISTDLIVPLGLRSATVSIAAAGPGVGGSGAGRLARATLSRFEAELAAGAAPVTPDVSGLATLDYRGLHRPFRDQIAAPPPNNDAAANGIVQTAAAEITGILPLTSSTHTQNAPDAWYGLYSFNLVAQAGAVQPGVITVTATPLTDGTTGNRFTYWAQNETSPRLSPAATGGTASVLSTIPPPGSWSCLVGAAAVATARRRRYAHAEK